MARPSYETQRAERRYRAVAPDNRLVARGLEAEWEKALRELDRAKAELAHREALRPKTLSANERCRLLALGTDLSTVWRAPSLERGETLSLTSAQLSLLIEGVDWHAPEQRPRPAPAG